MTGSAVGRSAMAGPTGLREKASRTVARLERAFPVTELGQVSHPDKLATRRRSGASAAKTRHTRPTKTGRRGFRPASVPMSRCRLSWRLHRATRLPDPWVPRLIGSSARSRAAPWVPRPAWWMARMRSTSCRCSEGGANVGRLRHASDRLEETSSPRCSMARESLAFQCSTNRIRATG